MGYTLIDNKASAFSEKPTATRTTCPYCGVGCGVLVEKSVNGVSVRGDPSHPANYGRLCSKGSALAETLGDHGRLIFPSIAGQRVSWETATTTIANKFKKVIADYGPDAVAFYVSGQLLTEDYYVANKLMKGFIGSANIDTNSRLCMASSVAGHKRAFGSDTVPGCYADLELADLVVLTGSNLAWCHPVLYQRIVAAKERRPAMKVVAIDPRQTATCDLADLHLALKPGSDAALFQGLLTGLNKSGACDDNFVRNHTDHVDEALRAAAPFDIARTVKETGLSDCEAATFFDWFAQSEKTVTVYSQGVNQAVDGTDRVNAIINCHLFTGRIGKPGAGPFSVTGQPNAMGGREVGGLANQLASHMDLENAEHRALVQTFWESPRIAEKPGLKAVDLFEAVYDGRVKAIWIMATNPVVSMPDADRVRDALRRCELTVVSDIYANTDTAACADILLPSTGWGEKSGMVTNSERRMSRQRAFLPEPGEARDDWRQFCDVAAAMGWDEAFSYDGPADIFREFAALCACENNGARDLDLSGAMGISDEGYENYKPAQWPIAKGARSSRLFSDGRFFTANGRANFVAPASPPTEKSAPDYPYTLNTGRIRDQWHTMTRTARAPRLNRHIAEPFVEISPGDAAREGLRDADIAHIKSPRGVMLVRILVTDRQQNGSLFAPMHWTDQLAKNGRVDSVTAPDVDPVSGQPALKSSKVRISRFDARWYGFAVAAGSDSDIEAFPGAAYCVKSVADSAVRWELAGNVQGAQANIFENLLAHSVQRTPLAEPQIIQYADATNRELRWAAFHEDRLIAAAFFSASPVTAARDWVTMAVGETFNEKERAHILAARPSAGQANRGAIICSCMHVGANDIAAAVKTGSRTVDAIAAATGAGTNCGSCRAELKQFLPERAYA